MKKGHFPYYLTKYFSEYLPEQAAASANTIRSYRDTFVQLMEYYKAEHHLPPEKLDYHEFTAERIEGFLHYLEEKEGLERVQGTSGWLPSIPFSGTSSTVTLPDLNSVRRFWPSLSKKRQ